MVVEVGVQQRLSRHHNSFAVEGNGIQNHFLNPLPGIPIVESPFFERIVADLGLDAKTLGVATDLRDKGYAVIAFPLIPIFSQMAAEIKTTLHSCCDWQGRKEGRVHDLRISHAWSIDKNVRRVACNPSIINLLTTLYGRRAFPFQTLTFAVGTEQHVDTDGVHFNSSPERFMCGVWVALGRYRPWPPRALSRVRTPDTRASQVATATSNVR
jgi:hypothetical protein